MLFHYNNNMLYDKKESNKAFREVYRIDGSARRVRFTQGKAEEVLGKDADGYIEDWVRRDLVERDGNAYKVTDEGRDLAPAENIENGKRFSSPEEADLVRSAFSGG